MSISSASLEYSSKETKANNMQDQPNACIALDFMYITAALDKNRDVWYTIIS